jgi:BolA family transcriptional regulator, general stress-responsive regulator
VAESRVDRIRAILEQSFAPDHLAVEDQSHLHKGHAGAATGRGHFHVDIVAAAFAGLPPIARHRRIYAALADLLQTDIHALSLRARAPGEPA